MKIQSILVAIAFIISGCATVPPLQTSTGKPEVIINDVPKKDVSDALVNFMLSNDFQILNKDEYRLVFGKIDTSIGASLLLGSRYDSNPQWRYTFNLVDYSNGIRVITNIEAVTNPGSAFERKMDFSKSSKMANHMQSVLIDLKKNLETYREVTKRGKVGIKVDKGMIFEVFKGSPAEKAGIQIGDLILKIDNIELTGDFYKDTMMITGEPGSTVVFEIDRDGQILTIPIVRGNP